jgi:ATP-dependent DNA helicase RecG
VPIATTSSEFEHWLSEPEGAHLEFKSAGNEYSFDKLVRYCCALANEGGGKVILGVTDARPRMVLGTHAFQSPQRTVNGLVERLHLRIEGEDYNHDGKRVLIFHIPSRPLGMPISFDGAYWARAGESLVAMTQDQLRRIFNETGPDFSAELCSKASVTDLDPVAIEDFRSRWIRKSGNQALATCSLEHLLTDAELISSDGVSYAALILFGTRVALGRHLAQAEVIFEYRSSESSIPYQQRLELRQGFFSFYDQLWQTINLRNDLQSYQDGLFRYDIPTFSEGVVRESILNAISHRDYRLSGSIFIKQFPRELEIISPGGFPPGITAANILDQQNPRNRRIAEAFARCGLIERSGQGMNRIYEETIRQSKPLPDFSKSAPHEVRLNLRGTIQYPYFIRFLEKIADEFATSFTTSDFLLLDAIQREIELDETLRQRIPRLADMGVIETIGRGRSARHFLSKRFYKHTRRTGAYTRKRGLDHETNKALLLKHVYESDSKGAPISELEQVLPSLARRSVQRLLEELRQEGKLAVRGSYRGSQWCHPDFCATPPTENDKVLGT